MTLGERIRIAREEKGFTRKALAEVLKIDQSQYGKIENNKLNPTLAQIVEICSILQQSLDYIVVGKLSLLHDDNSFKATEEINYKESYEMALKNIELQNEIIKLKDQVFALEKSQFKSRYEIGNQKETHSNVAESKSELK